jgi:hypothetical protein
MNINETIKTWTQCRVVSTVCEHCGETSVSLKAGEFDKISDYYVVKNSVPWFITVNTRGKDYWSSGMCYLLTARTRDKMPV